MRFVFKAILQPAIRMMVLSMMAVGWYLAAGYIFLVFLPTNFVVYTTALKNAGYTTYDVYFIWAWLPTLTILILGIFWASGLLGELWEIVKRL